MTRTVACSARAARKPGTEHSPAEVPADDHIRDCLQPGRPRGDGEPARGRLPRSLAHGRPRTRPGQRVSGMTRSTVCIRCGEIVVGRCTRCSTGSSAPRGPNPRRLAAYQRARNRLVTEHRRRFGPYCPRCGGREVPGDRRTTLSADHVVPLIEGGALLGAMTVCCVGCNARAGARLGKRPPGRTGGDQHGRPRPDPCHLGR